MNALKRKLYKIKRINDILSKDYHINSKINDTLLEDLYNQVKNSKYKDIVENLKWEVFVNPCRFELEIEHINLEDENTNTEEEEKLTIKVPELERKHRNYCSTIRDADSVNLFQEFVLNKIINKEYDQLQDLFYNIGG